MITPRFSCSQTEESVVISIYCPSVRAADVEINVDGALVAIHVNPYFLRLNFSKELVEDDASSAKYDPSSGYLIVTLSKENKGQTFEDLDLLAKLLAPRPANTQPPSVEVISSEEAPTEDDLVSKVNALSLEQNKLLEAAENDWQLPQQIPEVTNLTLQARYGFLDMHSGYLKHATHTENEVNELGDGAEIYDQEERRRARIEHEDSKWDEEHYMADFMDDGYIQELIHWEHPHVSDRTPVEFTEEENMTMLRLPRKEYLATSAQSHDLYLTLVSLLLSYMYDSRTTQQDPTPESAWTICNLTPAFSALDPPRSSHFAGDPHMFSNDELSDAIVNSYRRMLVFPLYRSFFLGEKCRKDVSALLRKGKRMVLRCLLEMKSILDHHETYYIYSKIWLDDFCVWIQADASDSILELLGQRLFEIGVDKDSIGWGLRELETAAQETLERESDSDDE